MKISVFAGARYKTRRIQNIPEILPCDRPGIWLRNNRSVEARTLSNSRRLVSTRVGLEISLQSFFQVMTSCHTSLCLPLSVPYYPMCQKKSIISCWCDGYSYNVYLMRFYLPLLCPSFLLLFMWSWTFFFSLLSNGSTNCGRVKTYIDAVLCSASYRDRVNRHRGVTRGSTVMWIHKTVKVNAQQYINERSLFFSMVDRNHAKHFLMSPHHTYDIGKPAPNWDGQRV